MGNITAEDMKNDYDWTSAFHEAIHHTYNYGYYEEGYSKETDKVSHVYHAVAGENDGDAWLCIVGWDGEEGDFAVMSACCDYTGWD